MHRRCHHAVVALLLFSLAASAQEKRPITIEDLWKVQRLGKPAISPDGKWVVVEVTTYSMEKNDSTSNLWLLSTDGKTQKQLTTFKGKDTGPVWAPDGKTIAFVSKRSGDHPQIQLISPAGGEARQLTNLPTGPSGLKWAPDGKTIYCIVNTWPDTPDDDSYKKKEKARKDDKVQAYVIDDALFRYWDHWIADGKRPVLFSVDVESGKHKNLFTHTKLSLPVTKADAESYDISPDGKELCFTAETTKELGTDFNLDLYTMPLQSPDRKGAGEQPKNITTDNSANDFNPRYIEELPNALVFLRQTTKFFYADRARIMLYHGKAKGTGEFAPDFDRSVAAARWFGWGVLFEAEDQGFHRLYKGLPEPGKKSLSVEPLTEGYSDTSFDYRQANLVFQRSGFDLPAQVFCLTEKRPTRIDKFNDNLLKEWNLGPVKNVTIKGADDEDVQMWIVYPPNFDAKKKYPCLMFIHGGPHNGITTDFSYRWNPHVFAAKGYVVAIPNFHGSSGFGQKFTDSITGDMATKPFIDVMKATDYMAKQPYIDGQRMAAAGGSYGGYMMAWLNGHTDRFKAMICHAGVYNWHSMAASDVLRGRERSLGATPWGDLTQIDKQSPERFAANFKTPTLVIHGEKDYRVPITQGLEYYSTLRLKGVPTRLVYFPDENHWILKPQNSRLWYREFFAWLDKYVGAGPSK